MSRVNIKFSRTDKTASSVRYNVISPDFSERGTEDEVIGELTLNLLDKSFSYESVESLKSEFFPPEHFERYDYNNDDDYEKVRQICEREGYRCTVWAHRIYKKARELLELDYFPEKTNTGLETKPGH
jgi:hypothetical protein